MTHKEWSLIGVLGLIPSLLILTATRLSLVPAVVFTIPLVGGLALWLATTYKTQVDPLKHVGMILGELAHFVFPFMEDGTFHYVSGMYTALLPLFPASYGLHVTLREISTARSKAPSI
jgi:hypothetical protein